MDLAEVKQADVRFGTSEHEELVRDLDMARVQCAGLSAELDAAKVRNLPTH